MATVNVIKGSADEAILRKQYGDTVNYNYSDKNQFAGADRFVTNKMYQAALGKPVNDAGDLWGYSGVAVDNNAKPAAPQYNPLDQMEQLKQAQLKASMAGLDKQRNNSLSNLQAERAVIEPQYQKQKIAANVTARQTARSFDEYMAQRGGNNSGIAGQGQLMNSLGYQGQKGALDQGEAMAISDNARRVTGVNNNFESDRVSAEAGIESQYLQNYINQMNTDRTFNYGVSRDNVADDRYNTETTYGRGRDSLEDSRYNDTTTYARQQDELNRVLELQKLAASGGGSITQSSTTGKTNMDDAMIEIDNQLKSGTSPGNVAYSIEQQRESLKRQGINVDALIKSVWEKSGLQTKPEQEDSWR